MCLVIGLRNGKSVKYYIIRATFPKPNESERCEPNESQRCEPNESERCDPNESERCEPNESERCEPNESERCEPNESERCAPNKSERCEPNESESCEPCCGKITCLVCYFVITTATFTKEACQEIFKIKSGPLNLTLKNICIY